MSHARCFAAVLLCACAGTETGNPSFEGELAYDAYSTDPAVAALRQGDSAVVVEQAWLVLGDVRFLKVERCDEPQSAPVHAPGLGAGDHAMEGAARTPFEAEIGEYCGALVPFVLAGEQGLPGAAPETLPGHSIVLSGVLTESGNSFRIESAYDRELLLSADAASFALGPDDARVLLSFDLARWLAGSDLAALTPDGDGLVLVSSESNADVLEQLEENLAGGVELRRDPEGTGLAQDATERIAHVAD